MFQCSSASRKFLNAQQRVDRAGRCGFSALQRAENSSIDRMDVIAPDPHSFSALQRAENSSIHHQARRLKQRQTGFSALQRAENSSIGQLRGVRTRFRRVSVLFSEPKIPQ